MRRPPRCARRLLKATGLIAGAMEVFMVEGLMICLTIRTDLSGVFFTSRFFE